MGLKYSQIILLIIIGISSGNSQHISINCSFELIEFATVGQLYTCIVQNKLNILQHGVLISNTSGTYADNMTADSVTGLVIENMNVEYLPINIGEIFKNLMALKVKNASLKELNKESLKLMPNLKYLNLDENNIEVLDKDIFEGNPNLQLLWLSDNKIRKIEESLIDNFRNLTNLDLSGNVCTTKKFSLLHSLHVNTSNDRNIQNKFSILTNIMQSCSNFTNTIFEVEVKPEVQDDPTFKIYQEQVKTLNNQLFNTKSELNGLKLKFIEEMSSKNNTLKKLQEIESNEVNAGLISELKNKLLKEEKEVKNLKDELKKFKGIYDEFLNLKKILKVYEEERYSFSEQIKRDQAELKKLQVENKKLKKEIKKLSIAHPDGQDESKASETTNIGHSTVLSHPIADSEEDEIIEETTLYDYYS